MKKLLCVLIGIALIASLSCFAAGAASYIKGDADGNGKTDIRDVTAMQRDFR